MNKIAVVVDGPNMVHRHYHTAEGLRDSKGNFTGGLFGFLKGIGMVAEKFNPHALFTVWDGGLDSFRVKLLPGYKDRRESDPEKEQERQDVRTRVSWQIERLKTTALPLAGIPVLHLPGVEADDIIYTLTHRLLARDYRVVVVSSDKDFYQLVNETVMVWNPMKKLGKGKGAPVGMLLHLGNYEEMLGVPTPTQYLHSRVLQGDSSDRIPGVPGFGEKRAHTLMIDYGGIPGLFQNKEALCKRGKTFKKLFEPESQQIILRNIKLMALDRRPEPEGEREKIAQFLKPTALFVNKAELKNFVFYHDAIDFGAHLEQWALVMHEVLTRFHKFQS